MAGGFVICVLLHHKVQFSTLYEVHKVTIRHYVTTQQYCALCCDMQCHLMRCHKMRHYVTAHCTTPVYCVVGTGHTIQKNASHSTIVNEPLNRGFVHTCGCGGLKIESQGFTALAPLRSKFIYLKLAKGQY